MADVWLCIRCLRPLPHAADWDFWCDHCADTTAGLRWPDEPPNYEALYIEHMRRSRMPTEAEAELEAALWKALHDFSVTVDEALLFVDHLIGLAKSYAAGDSEEIAEARRAVLARDAKRSQ